MRTLLFSTSSLWNCGDDFIRDGVTELLQLKDDVRVLWWNRGFGMTPTFANSLRTNLPLMDYFLVAGTPKWVYNNEKIYLYCLKHAVPLSLIGVGTRDIINNRQLKLMKRVAGSSLCELALARDHIAYRTLKDELGFKNVELILDPCFFKQPCQFTSTEKQHILGWREQFGLLYGDPLLPVRHPLYVASAVLKKMFGNIGQRLNRTAYDQCFKEIYRKLPTPKLVVVHDNREVSKAERLFGKDQVYYASDYHDMFNMFARAKTYTGSRIHGAIPAIIHGASIRLVYTNSKAVLLKDSTDILSKYYPSVTKHIHVDIVGDVQSLAVDIDDSATMDLDSLRKGIGEEKKRVRNILKNAPILSQYMSS